MDEIADFQGNDIVLVFDVLPAILEYLFGDTLFQIHITPCQLGLVGFSLGIMVTVSEVMRAISTPLVMLMML